MTAPIWLAPTEAWACSSQGDADDCSHSAVAQDAPDPELNGRTLLIVLCGSPGRRRLLHSLRTAGLRLVCYNPSIPAWAREYVDEWIVGPINDVDAAHAAVNAWLSAWRSAPCEAEHLQQPHSAGAGARDSGTAFDGLLCYDEYGLQLACRLCQALGLPASPAWAVEVVRSKRLFREACMSGGVPTPRFAHLTAPATPENPEQLEALKTAGIRFPVVAKPSGCAGSFSVTRANGLEDLAAATQLYYDRLPAYISALGLSPTSTCATGGMVVEEMITGQEVDVDCIVMGGRLLFACVSDNNPCKAVDGVAAFVETGGCCPSFLPQAVQEQLLQLTASVVSLFGDSLSGVLHFEAKYDQEKQLAMPIELNARIGGAETFTNVKSAWGVDLVRAAARIACGLLPQLPPHLHPHAHTHLKSEPTPCVQPHQISHPIQPAAHPATCVPKAPVMSSSCCGCTCQEHPPACEAAHGHAADASKAQAPCSCRAAAAKLRQEAAKEQAAQEQKGHKAGGEPGQRPHSIDVFVDADSALQTRATTPCECGCTGICCCCASANDYWSFLSLRHSSASVTPHPGRMVGLPAVMALSEPTPHDQLQLRTATGSSHKASFELSSCLSSNASEAEVAVAGAHHMLSLDHIPHEQHLHRLTTHHKRNPSVGSTCSSGCAAPMTGPAANPGPAVAAAVHGGAGDSGAAGSTCAEGAASSAGAAAPRAPTCMDPSWLRPSVTPVTHVASINFVPEWSGVGVVEVLQVTPGALASDAYIDHELYYQPGDIARLPPAGFSALGWMVAKSDLGVSQATHALNALVAQGVVIQLRKP